MFSPSPPFSQGTRVDLTALPVSVCCSSCCRAGIGAACTEPLGAVREGLDLQRPPKLCYLSKGNDTWEGAGTGPHPNLASECPVPCHRHWSHEVKPEGSGWDRDVQEGNGAAELLSPGSLAGAKSLFGPGSKSQSSSPK